MQIDKNKSVPHKLLCLLTPGKIYLCVALWHKKKAGLVSNETGFFVLKSYKINVKLLLHLPHSILFCLLSTQILQCHLPEFR